MRCHVHVRQVALDGKDRNFGIEQTADDGRDACIYGIYKQRLDTTGSRIFDVAGLLLGFVLGVKYNQLETLLRRFLTDALNHRGVEWIGRT